jgi:hypothetical protein
VLDPTWLSLEIALNTAEHIFEKAGINNLKTSYGLLWMQKPGLYYDVRDDGRFLIFAIHGSPLHLDTHKISGQISDIGLDILSLKVKPRLLFIIFESLLLLIPIIFLVNAFFTKNGVSIDGIFTSVFMTVLALLLWIASIPSAIFMRKCIERIEIASKQV